MKNQFLCCLYAAQISSLPLPPCAALPPHLSPLEFFLQWGTCQICPQSFLVPFLSLVDLLLWKLMGLSEATGIFLPSCAEPAAETKTEIP